MPGIGGWSFTRSNAWGWKSPPCHGRLVPVVSPQLPTPKRSQPIAGGVAALDRRLWAEFPSGKYQPPSGLGPASRV